MMVGTRCDLGQVRDREDLMVLGNLPELGANVDRDTPSDTRVDLIEDEGGYAVDAGEDGFEGEHDAGELAARRNARELSGIEPRIQRDAEVDVFRAVRGHFR